MESDVWVRRLSGHGLARVEAIEDLHALLLRATYFNDVPLDVLAERWDTTRGAIYKTLHDATRASGSSQGRQDDA